MILVAIPFVLAILLLTINIAINSVAILVVAMMFILIGNLFVYLEFTKKP